MTYTSRQATMKYILVNFNVGSDAKVVNTNLQMALESGVKSKTLKQAKAGVFAFLGFAAFGLTDFFAGFFLAGSGNLPTLNEPEAPYPV